MMFITLDQAKAQMRVTHDEDDEQIEEMIEAASATIYDYLKSAAAAFVDSSLEVDEDAVPATVVMACKITVADWYKNREGQRDNAVPAEFGYGYSMPAAAIALLYPLRVPTLA